MKSSERGRRLRPKGTGDGVALKLAIAILVVAAVAMVAAIATVVWVLVG